jgi:hypothetical protein
MTQHVPINRNTIPVFESLGIRVERMIETQMQAYPSTWSNADRREMAERYFSKGGVSDAE